MSRTKYRLTCYRPIRYVLKIGDGRCGLEGDGCHLMLYVAFERSRTRPLRSLEYAANQKGVLNG
jgi:hypothetical protein